MKKVYIIASTIFLAAALFFLGVSFSKIPKAEADSIPTIGFRPFTQSATLCTNGASTLMVATSTGREFLKISNLSSSSVYLGIGVPAGTSTGMLLAASSTMNFDHSSVIFTGAIYCLSETGRGVATTTAVQYP